MANWTFTATSWKAVGSSNLIVYLLALLRAGAVKTTEQAFEDKVQVWELTMVELKGLFKSLISLNWTVIDPVSTVFSWELILTVTSPVVYVDVNAGKTN